MKDSEFKFEEELDGNGLKTFFLDFTNNLVLDETSDNGSEFSTLPKASKIKISLKRRNTLPEKYQVKLKWKIRSSESPPGSGDETMQSESNLSKKSYKKLKKRMEQSFKELYLTIKTDEFPSDELIERFLHESVEMVSYAGFGDSYYETYKGSCQKLKTAFDNEDKNAIKASLLELNRLKKSCHDRYK